MSKLVIDGQTYDGANESLAAIFTAILAVKRRGQPRFVVFDSEPGTRAVVHVTEMTAVQLRLDGPAADPMISAFSPNIQDILHRTDAD